MQIAMRHNNQNPTNPTVYNNPFGPAPPTNPQANPQYQNPNPQQMPNPQHQNPQFQNPQFQNPQQMAFQNPQYPNPFPPNPQVKPTGPFANPPPMNAFPVVPFNPQMAPPPTGIQYFPPQQQPFPGNFPNGPVVYPVQYGNPGMQFPAPPQFYYGPPPTGMPPVNPNMGTQPQQPKNNNSPNKPF